MEATPKCIRCGLKAGTFKCSRCKLVYYCSQTCQIDHWRGGHKGQCTILSEGKNGKEFLAPKSATPSSSSSSTSSASNNTSLARHDSKPDGVVLFDPERMKRLITFRPPGEETLQGCGLYNAGTTCYINATLQCLVHTYPLRSYLLSSLHSQTCKVKDRQFCMMCGLEEHTQKEFDGTLEWFLPRNIYSNLMHIGEFRYNAQEDAHEFCVAVLTRMQDSLLENYKLASNSDGNLKKSITLTPNEEETSFIYQLFGGSMLSQIRCNACERVVSSRREPFLDLSLELSSGNSLEEALYKFTEIEHFDLATGYKCEHCNKVVEAQKQLTIHQSPNVLIIQLKRFDVMHGGGKINKPIAFRDQLDINHIVNSNNQSNTAHKYRLYAVLVHYGRTMFVGHYVAFVKSPSGVWYLFDDKKIIEVSEAIVLKQNAYLLFYEKILPAQGQQQSQQSQQQQSQQQKKKRSRNNRKQRQQQQSQQQPQQQAVKQEEAPKKEEVQQPLQQQQQEPVAKQQEAPKQEEVKYPSAASIIPVGAEFDQPKYESYYTEATRGDESYLKDIIILLNTPKLTNIEVKDSAVEITCSGLVWMRFNRIYGLDLQLPFGVSPANATVTLYRATKNIVVTIPVQIEQEKDEPLNAQTVAIKVVEGQCDIKALLSGSVFEIPIEPLPILPPLVDQDAPLPGNNANSNSNATEESAKKKDAGNKPLPYMDFSREGLMKMMNDQSNQEEATYAKLYKDIEEYHKHKEELSKATLLANAQKEREKEEAWERLLKKTGRNDTCPCGSGKKFKVCHGKQ